MLNYLLSSVPLDRLIDFAIYAGILIGAFCIGRILHAFFMRLPGRLSGKLPLQFLIDLQPYISRPSRWIFVLSAVDIAFAFVPVPPPWDTRIHHCFDIFIIGSFGWMFTGLTLAASEWLKNSYSATSGSDVLKYRSINTQLRVFTHVAIFLVWLLTAITIIMTIPHLRSIGVSLFASAGVAGIVIGMAAGPTLSNLIAGIQLALTQPIRIGDQIVIGTVSGIVDEIDSTYVVVRLWDMRRLIVPLNYFIQNQFQNWTHTLTSSICGTVPFYIDYTIDVAAVRKELERLVKTLPRWDGKCAILRVTDLKDSKMVELHAVVSTKDAGDIYPLQCEVREGLLQFIRAQQPPAK